MPEIDTNEFEFSVLTEALNKFIANYGEENLPAGFLDLTKSFQSHNIDIQDWNTLVEQVAQAISGSNTCKEFLIELTEFVKGYLSHTYTIEQIDNFLNLKADKSTSYVKTELYNRTESDTRFVHLSTNESVSGIKTFSSVPKTLGNPSSNNDLSTKKYVDDENLKDVHLTGAQTVSGVKVFVDIPQTQLGRNYDADEPSINARKFVDKQYTDAHINNTNNPHNVTKTHVGLGNVTNDAQVKRTEMGAANGVATLDASGKLPLNQLTDIALGQLTPGGTVTGSGLATLTTNAKTVLNVLEDQIQLLNNPEGDTGYLANQVIYYVCTSAGSFAGLDLQVGDWLTATASGWIKVDNTDAVQSVQGRTGAVVITKTDIGLQYIETDIAPIYSSSSTYALYDVVIYNGKLYKCTTAVTVAEAFDSTKWQETSVSGLLEDFKYDMRRLPQYEDLTILATDWSNNECSISTGVLDLENTDTVLALPNDTASDAYIRAFNVVLTSFNNTTGVATFTCFSTPTETINITLQILRR